MTEQKAITLCLEHRDPAGFEFLVAQYRREAYYHAYALLGNSEDAADVCQDAFVRAFAAMPRLEALDRFYPWFYRILRNRCLNLLSRRNTREKHAQAVRQHLETGGGSTATSPSANVQRNEERRQVWTAIEKLSPQHREILTLKYIHGLKYDAISETLGIPRGTVMSRLYAARQTFRTRFETLDQPQPPPNPEVSPNPD